MRYHYAQPLLSVPVFGRTFICSHPVYDRGTLFEAGNKGLCVIQQRYDPETKHTWWGEIDPWLRNEIYMHPNFKPYFDKYADIWKDGLYPTVTVRQIMWGLKMKPMKRELWETCFDHAPV